MTTQFQDLIIEHLNSKKTWNSSVLKERMRWKWAEHKSVIPQEEFQTEKTILGNFVLYFVDFIITKSNKEWMDASSVVIMYEQCIADTKPFELDGE